MGGKAAGPSDRAWNTVPHSADFRLCRIICILSKIYRGIICIQQNSLFSMFCSVSFDSHVTPSNQNMESFHKATSSRVPFQSQNLPPPTSATPDLFSVLTDFSRMSHKWNNTVSRLCLASFPQPHCPSV